MHLIQVPHHRASKRARFTLLWSLLVVLALAIGACGAGDPTPTPTPLAPTVAPPAAAEPTATPEPEEEAAEVEPTATPEPEEEAEPTATPAAEEEPDATATPVQEEEAEPTATAQPEEEPAAASGPADGVYIMTLAGCGCHFNRDEGALAGGNRFPNPLGVAYARNITPDVETGIGSWTEEEIAAALRLGVRPDGTQLVRAMPYVRFSVLSDQEALAVAAHLLALDPVANEVPARELSAEPDPFTPEAEFLVEPPTDPVARGQQLVTLTNCTSCHTPLDSSDAPDASRYMAGATLPNDDIAANITPHDGTGIGTWSEQEIATYLRTGTRPDGSLAGGAMSQEIDRRFSTLTEEDALAIAAYLKSIPAVENDPYSQ